ncbi:MAG: CRISPR-associated helicase Cas3' [Chloroflexi bacterium]|nr:CRISPR-associated helicase Cas3' [Chloroflexota bacterium]
MVSDGAQRLAAKFRTNTGGATSYHPLACHMADVAAVALALWDECLPTAIRHELAAGLGLPQDDARQWVAFLAGLHDLGKASRPWQAKYDKDHAARLAGTGLSATTNATDPGHGIVTAAQLPGLLTMRGVDRDLAQRLGTVVGGHHGVFPLLARGQGEGRDIREQHSDVRWAWEAARQELFDQLAEVMDLGPVPTGSLPNAAVMLLGGFVSIADWIGSIEDPGFFEYDLNGAADLAAYFDRAKRRAEQALVTLQWKAYPGAKRRTFEEAFDGKSPRPLQEKADSLRVPGATPPLVIIEAPMGEGKTEAALHLLEGWTADGTARGFYIALPTQATANQMHGRVAGFLKDAFAPQLSTGEDVNLVLAHGGAWLKELEHLPSGVYEDNAPRTGAVGAGEWFLSRKRSLLAPYGVGTIDQALMAVLQVKHVFVRLYGLGGKAVVIDEVHAYDTYMTGLLERLLEWLGALVSPVVLLSATLPTSRRQMLAEAYRRGQGVTVTGGETEPTAYPRITWLEGGEVRAESFPAADRSKRALNLNKIEDSPESVRKLLLEELKEGGCAVVICNTVARAQETYAALKPSFPGEIGLFHARFLAKDRQRIEGDCLRRFGPPSEDGVERPRRFVLVATQVGEQSLDVDFDMMVTDLAPVDLLLQRSGRLHRHEANRRPGGPPPVLHIRWPEEREGSPTFDRASTYVYDEHILLRTWHALRDRDSIAVPDDIQSLVDRVYEDDEAVPTGADTGLAKRWRETWEGMEGKKRNERSEADHRRVRTPVGTTALPSDFQRFWREEDSPELHPALQALTRLTEPSVDVVFLPEGSPLLPGGNKPPDREHVKQLLLNSISVSSRMAVPVLFRQKPPPAFETSSALRRHRLLVLDARGEVHVDRLVFRYDAELGLEIAREE